VAGALECSLDSGDFPFWIDERGCVIGDGLAGRLLRPEAVGEGLQATVASNSGLGPTLGAVGQVQIFEFRLVKGGLDPGLEFVGKLALLEDGAEDGLAAADEVSKVAELRFDVANLDLVEVASGLFAIASNEGDGAAFVEQTDNGGEGVERKVKRLSDMQENFGGESLRVDHDCFLYRGCKGSGKADSLRNPDRDQ
jgi:hypothetical protein